MNDDDDRPSAPPLPKISLGAASDVGAVRAVNEDSLIAQEPIFAVADGMGGHRFGDRASQETVRVLRERLAGATAVTSSDVLRALTAANAAVRALSDGLGGDAAAAGTTVTGLALVQGPDQNRVDWMAFNVGDSRTYTWDGLRLVQLSVDHSAVQELIDAGTITVEEASTHPQRSVITRALGVDDAVEPDVWLVPTGGRQVFLLCSDGLTKEVSDVRIAEIFTGGDTAQSTADSLVAEALAAGGSDNVTALVVEADWNPAATRGRGAFESALPAFLEETMPRTGSAS